MSLRWVASATRGLGLAGRCLGASAAEQVAGAPSLQAALDVVTRSIYGRDVRADMDLGGAQHAVRSTALWQLRVLAGWGPALGAAGLRVIAGRFEIENLVGHALELEGAEAEAPFALGALATAWSAAAGTRSMPALRRALASSAWGDPGGDDPATMRLGLELSWARQLADIVPESAAWAVAYAAVLAAKLVATESVSLLADGPQRDLRRLIGARAEAVTIGDLAGRLPPSVSYVLAGLDDPAQLWMGETRWWARVETQAGALSRAARPDAASAVGTGMMLLADARRVCAALELAARGGSSLAEVSGAVA
ncbi:MAG TPA: hypothetical protein VEH29_14835 [Acidimicrobiales bacterium]|nr:hypothetical protein [Acidimicrobiales bacterium]